MPDFAVISQKGGIAENIPTVLLSEVFMAKGSENVHHRYGRYDRLRGRLPDLFDSETVKIKAPTDVYVITGINTGTKTITITGDHSAGATVLAVGATIRINGGTTAGNNITFTVDTLPTTSTIVTAETLEAAGATPGNVFVGATPVIEYHRHIRQGTGTEHLLLGTKYHILLWLQSDRSLTVKWTTTDPANVFRWEITDHLRNVVATNNSDFVLWWNVDSSVSNAFAALDNADGIDYEGTANRLTKCKHIFSYERYLILGYTTEAGTVYPQRERWAGLATGGSAIDFDENGSSDAGRKEFTTTPGFLMGFARHGDDLVIAKQDSMHRSWLVTADTVFEWEEYTLKVGNLSADSLINDKAGRLYWMGSDLTIREINTPQPISTAVDITVKGLNTAQSEFIQGTYIEEFEEIWWAIPSSGSDTNDTIIAFHPDSGRSFIYKIPVRAFGDFTQQEAFTYDTLPFDTYADWGADWLLYDTQRNVVGFPLDLASDYLGNTFDLHRADKDDGNDFTGKLKISTTLTVPKSLNLFKRINNGVDVIMNRKSSGSVTLYVKRDTEASRQLLGTASMVDANLPETVIVHVPFDKRARSFEFEIETTDQMEFLGMLFREFEVDDSR
ncbi:hypothetical protein LCGC14_0400450 [marine sediment metagenome]|uniref:Ubiquitin-activating enzyme E1 FCCH domain-containing protein n=1 Tax=marine sediment metagenome TaxID=412755 RepID=A0A0F9SX28_9ZZZZ